MSALPSLGHATVNTAEPRGQSDLADMATGEACERTPLYALLDVVCGWYDR